MVDEEEKEGGEEEEGEEEEGVGEEEDADEVAEAAHGKRAAKDDEHDNVDTKKQKTDEDKCTGNNEVKLKKKTCSPSASPPRIQRQSPWSRESRPPSPPAAQALHHPTQPQREFATREGKKNHNFQGLAFFLKMTF